MRAVTVALVRERLGLVGHVPAGEEPIRELLVLVDAGVEHRDDDVLRTGRPVPGRDRVDVGAGHAVHPRDVLSDVPHAVLQSEPGVGRDAGGDAPEAVDLDPLDRADIGNDLLESIEHGRVLEGRDGPAVDSGLPCGLVVGGLAGEKRLQRLESGLEHDVVQHGRRHEVLEPKSRAGRVREDPAATASVDLDDGVRCELEKDASGRLLVEDADIGRGDTAGHENRAEGHHRSELGSDLLHERRSLTQRVLAPAWAWFQPGSGPTRR